MARFGRRFPVPNPFKFRKLATSGSSSHTMVADTGSFALTGQPAEIYEGNRLVADAGAFSLAGQACDIHVFHTLTADAGSFSLAGIASEIYVGNRLVADAGSFSLAGQFADIHVAHTLTTDSGSFFVVGIDAAFVPDGAPTSAVIVRRRVNIDTPRSTLARPDRIRRTLRRAGRFVLTKVQ